MEPGLYQLFQRYRVGEKRSFPALVQQGWQHLVKDILAFVTHALYLRKLVMQRYRVVVPAHRPGAKRLLKASYHISCPQWFLCAEIVEHLVSFLSWFAITIQALPRSGGHAKKIYAIGKPNWQPGIV
jgi:hypothetical protein